MAILIILYDLAYYDPSYLNRKAVTFSINNLNSKKVKKLIKYPEKFFYYLGYKFSKEQKEFWEIEDPLKREKLPKILKISSKKIILLQELKLKKLKKIFLIGLEVTGVITRLDFPV